MKKVLLSMICAAACTVAMAQTSTQNRPEGFKKDPTVEAAFKECASTVAKDTNGHPNREAMHECLKAKGINPPPHGPHGNGMGGMGHPRENNQSGNSARTSNTNDAMK